MKSEMIRLLPVYQGVDSENPYSFMRDFEDVCNAFLSTGSPLHIKEGPTNALMRAIQKFSKKSGEPFSIVWERYKDLLHALLHHGLDVGQIVAYFHQGLSVNNKQYIQLMCAGEFYEKSVREAVQFFDTIAENARTWETNTSLDTAKVHSIPTRGGIHHVRENDDLQEKITNLTRKLEAIELKKVHEVTVVPKVPSMPMGSGVDESCIICDDPTHSTINCPNLP